ncbi:hypothetical protein DPMN_117996 [Dreissena polymorpha]|uniref:DDE-1 domain-containing protein n=1 Tax=Dreissena polymorpha TaxID=45954 RepID=A0A9D4GK04_DREPO|nr:hypothetical protein DPMN_117996 [Dreissena polymorpha]
MWNIDDTCLVMEHHPGKVVCLKWQTVNSVTSARCKKSHHHYCRSKIPPFYIFPCQRWRKDLLNDSSPKSNVTVPESFWSNSDVFLHFMKNHFKHHVPCNGPEPVIILFDGYISHINLTLDEWEEQNNIVFFSPSSHIACHPASGCVMFRPLQERLLQRVPGIHEAAPR